LQGPAAWAQLVSKLSRLWQTPERALDIVGELPSGYVKIAIENGPVEIVDLPIEPGWIFPSFFVCLPEGKGRLWEMFFQIKKRDHVCEWVKTDLDRWMFMDVYGQPSTESPHNEWLLSGKR